MLEQSARLAYLVNLYYGDEAEKISVSYPVQLKESCSKGISILASWKIGLEGYLKEKEEFYGKSAEILNKLEEAEELYLASEDEVSDAEQGLAVQYDVLDTAENRKLLRAKELRDNVDKVLRIFDEVFKGNPHDDNSLRAACEAIRSSGFLSNSAVVDEIFQIISPEAFSKDIVEGKLEMMNLNFMLRQNMKNSDDKAKLYFLAREIIDFTGSSDTLDSLDKRMTSGGKSVKFFSSGEKWEQDEYFVKAIENTKETLGADGLPEIPEEALFLNKLYEMIGSDGKFRKEAEAISCSELSEKREQLFKITGAKNLSEAREKVEEIEDAFHLSLGVLNEEGGEWEERYKKIYSNYLASYRNVEELVRIFAEISKNIEENELLKNAVNKHFVNENSFYGGTLKEVLDSYRTYLTDAAVLSGSDFEKTNESFRREHVKKIFDYKGKANSVKNILDGFFAVKERLLEKTEAEIVNKLSDYDAISYEDFDAGQSVPPAVLTNAEKEGFRKIVERYYEKEKTMTGLTDEEKKDRKKRDAQGVPVELKIFEVFRQRMLSCSGIFSSLRRKDDGIYGFSKNYRLNMICNAVMQGKALSANERISFIKNDFVSLAKNFRKNYRVEVGMNPIWIETRKKRIAKEETQKLRVALGNLETGVKIASENFALENGKQAGSVFDVWAKTGRDLTILNIEYAARNAIGNVKDNAIEFLSRLTSLDAAGYCNYLNSRIGLLTDEEKEKADILDVKARSGPAAKELETFKRGTACYVDLKHIEKLETHFFELNEARKAVSVLNAKGTGKNLEALEEECKKNLEEKFFGRWNRYESIIKNNISAIENAKLPEKVDYSHLRNLYKDWYLSYVFNRDDEEVLRKEIYDINPQADIPDYERLEELEERDAIFPYDLISRAECDRAARTTMYLELRAALNEDMDLDVAKEAIDAVFSKFGKQCDRLDAVQHEKKYKEQTERLEWLKANQKDIELKLSSPKEYANMFFEVAKSIGGATGFYLGNRIKNADSARVRLDEWQDLKKSCLETGYSSELCKEAIEKMFSSLKWTEKEVHGKLMIPYVPNYGDGDLSDTNPPAYFMRRGGNNKVCDGVSRTGIVKGDLASAKNKKKNEHPVIEMAGVSLSEHKERKSDLDTDLSKDGVLEKRLRESSLKIYENLEHKEDYDYDVGFDR